MEDLLEFRWSQFQFSALVRRGGVRVGVRDGGDGGADGRGFCDAGEGYPELRGAAWSSRCAVYGCFHIRRACGVRLRAAEECGGAQATDYYCRCRNHQGGAGSLAHSDSVSSYVRSLYRDVGLSCIAGRIRPMVHAQDSSRDDLGRRVSDSDGIDRRLHWTNRGLACLRALGAELGSVRDGGCLRSGGSEGGGSWNTALTSFPFPGAFLRDASSLDLR